MAAGSTYLICNIIQDILSILNWCANADALDYTSNRFFPFVFACAEFLFDFERIEFLGAFLALPFAAYAYNGAAVCVRHWLLHFGEKPFPAYE